MAKRERIPDEVRAQIADAIRSGGTCRGIARDFEVSTATVRKIAEEYEITDAFAREQTQKATRARVADLAARRAVLAERALDVAERALTRAMSPYTVIVATKDEVFHEQLPEPPANELRQFATSYGIFVDKHMALIRFDTKEATNPAAAALVDRLAAMLQLDQGNDELVDDGYPTPLPAVDPAGDDGYVAPDMGALS